MIQWLSAYDGIRTVFRLTRTVPGPKTVDSPEKIVYHNSLTNLKGETGMRARSKIIFASAMAIFGTLGLFTRNIGVSSAELALCRSVLAALLVGAYMVLTRQSIDVRKIKKQLLLLALSGMVMSISWILLFEAYRYTSISVATLSYYFAPVLITVGSAVLFKERLSGRQILSFIMSTLGIVIITAAGGLEGGPSDLRGIVLGLLAAVTYAAVILLNKYITDVEGIVRTLLQFIATLIVLVPYVAFSGGLDLSVLDGVGWACLLTVGLVHTGLTYCMYFSALKDMTGQEAAILSYIDPLVAVFISAVFLHETMLPLQILGGAMVLGFTIWNELGGAKK